MMNLESLASLRAKAWLNGLFRPDDGYNFSRIPATIERSFGLSPRFGPELPHSSFESARRVSKVILILVDGFGLRFFDRFKNELPFLRRFLERGRASGISSQFPSTTAAHVTTIHYGLPAATHGIYEWFIYEPVVGAVIAPLPMSIAGDPRPERVPKLGVNLDDILPKETFYQSLAVRGVKSRVYQDAHISKSSFSKHALRGADIHPTKSLESGLVDLSEEIKRSDSPAYFFFYADSVDLQSHRTGPDSPEVDAEIRRVFGALENILAPAIARENDLALFITADHGHVETDPAACFYINKEIPGIEDSFLSGSRSGKILFAGSARDLFLHVESSRAKEVKTVLSEKLEGRAQVLFTADYMGELFGRGPYSERFLSRLGNILILPYAGQSVFWHEPGKFEMRFRGHHGGLTGDELHSIFLTQYF